MWPRQSSMCGSTSRVMRSRPRTFVSSIVRSSSSEPSAIGRAAEREAGVVHEDVDAAELLHGLAHERLAARRVGDVERRGDVARAGQLGGRLLDELDPARAEREPGALGCERAGGRRARSRSRRR